MAFHRILVWHCLVAVGPWFDPCHGSFWKNGRSQSVSKVVNMNSSGHHNFILTFLETTQKNLNNHIHPIPYLIIFVYYPYSSLRKCPLFIMFHRRSYFEPQPEVCTEEPFFVVFFFFSGCWLGTVSTRSTRCEYKLVRRFVVYRCLVIERPPVLAKVWICLGSWIAVIRQD